MLGNSHVRFWRRAGAGDCSCLASGFSVVGSTDTVLNLMVEAPDHVNGVARDTADHATGQTISQVAQTQAV